MSLVIDQCCLGCDLACLFLRAKGLISCKQEDLNSSGNSAEIDRQKRKFPNSNIGNYKILVNCLPYKAHFIWVMEKKQLALWAKSARNPSGDVTVCLVDVS